MSMSSFYLKHDQLYSKPRFFAKKSARIIHFFFHNSKLKIAIFEKRKISELQLILRKWQKWEYFSKTNAEYSKFWQVCQVRQKNNFVYEKGDSGGAVLTVLTVF